MPITAQGSGTQTATIGTEHTLLDIAIAGLFAPHVSLNAMALGDVVELRAYQIPLTGGTRRVVYLGRFAGVQPVDDVIAVGVPIGNELTDAGSLRFTLLQPFGTGRAFDWKVLKY